MLGRQNKSLFAKTGWLLILYLVCIFLWKWFFQKPLTLFWSGCSDSEQKPCCKWRENGRQVPIWYPTNWNRVNLIGQLVKVQLSSKSLIVASSNLVWKIPNIYFPSMDGCRYDTWPITGLIADHMLMSIKVWLIFPLQTVVENSIWMKL